MWEEELLPITVSVALVIFLLKEWLEINRTRKSRRIRLSAAAMLIGEELERNYYAARMLFKTIDFILSDTDSIGVPKDNKTHSYSFENINSPHLRFVCNSKDTYSSHPLPEMKVERYERMNSVVSELDETISKHLKDTYKNILLLDVGRANFINLINDFEKMDEDIREFKTDSLKDAVWEDKFFSDLKDTYFLLTGETMPKELTFC